MSYHSQMEFDFAAPAVPAPRPLSPRHHRGRTNQLAGVAAENSVARDYVRRGYRLLQQRWRGKGGEIDLIFAPADDETARVCVEVKKSSSFDKALTHLRPRQVSRILSAGAEYLGQCPKGSLTPTRFDFAVVNMHGEVKVLENAFGHF